MFRHVEVNPEDEEEWIRKAAERIHKYRMEMPAILLLESVKPLVYIGGQMGRFFISPYLTIFSYDILLRSEKFFTIFEKRENVEKLIQQLEKKAKGEDSEKPKEEQAAEEPRPKRGWRRFLQF